jgi:pimeloyl-ACP methyl ester carboxylesterase
MNPLLILHGALGAAPQLTNLKMFFKDEGYDTYTMNLSGHGGEAFQSSFGIEQFAEDVLNYLNIHTLDKVNIFGYSMGGYVSLWLAKNHPDKVGKILTLGTKFDWDIESAEKEVRKLNHEKIIEKVPAFARILEHRHAPNDWKVLLQKTGTMMLDLGKKPLLTKEILQTIHCPVLVCMGDQDDMADHQYSEEVASYLPNGKFYLLDNTPHPIEKVDFKKLPEFFQEFTD